MSLVFHLLQRSFTLILQALDLNNETSPGKISKLTLNPNFKKISKRSCLRCKSNCKFNHLTPHHRTSKSLRQTVLSIVKKILCVTMTNRLSKHTRQPFLNSCIDYGIDFANILEDISTCPTESSDHCPCLRNVNK